MTFSNRALQDGFVDPSGLLRLSNSYATTGGGTPTAVSTGDRILMADSQDLVGSSIATISGAGVITLPSGYYYLLEASLSIGDSSATSSSTTNREIYTRFYDETALSYIGTETYQNTTPANKTTDEADVPLSKDETARCWIDATGGAVDVSWKVSNVVYGNYDQSDTIYPNSNSPGELWVGYTRCLIWRFD
jgi:hypothetical protein